MKLEKICVQLITILFLTTISLPSYAAITVRECNLIADYVNESMGGMRIDNLTTLRAAACLPGPKLTYFQKVDAQLSKSDVLELLPSIREGLINRWCSDPDQRQLLFSLGGVGYEYEGHNGLFFGKIAFSKLDCGSL